MSKLAGKKRPLDSAEKAILATKKKIKSTNVSRSLCFGADAQLHCACKTHIHVRRTRRRYWPRWTSSAPW